VTFSDPATATGLDLKALLGSLLLIEPHEIVVQMATTFGPSDAIRADVAVLDGALAGQTFADTLIFPRVLQSQLRSRINEKVLGRLGQGAVRQQGQSAPWTLTAATEQDKALGNQYLATRVQRVAPAVATTPPAAAPSPWNAAPATAPAAPPWGAPATAPAPF
jgi:hypothetical protein